MWADIFFEATPSKSFVEGALFRQSAEIGDFMAQIERHLGCAADKSSADSLPRCSASTHTAATQGAYCGRSSRSQEMMSVDPR
jgi:hypothetical protein